MGEKRLLHLVGRSCPVDYWCDGVGKGRGGGILGLRTVITPFVLLVQPVSPQTYETCFYSAVFTKNKEPEADMCVPAV